MIILVARHPWTSGGCTYLTKSIIPVIGPKVLSAGPRAGSSSSRSTGAIAWARLAARHCRAALQPWGLQRHTAISTDFGPERHGATSVGRSASS